MERRTWLDDLLRECMEAPPVLGAIMFAVLVVGSSVALITVIVLPALIIHSILK